MYGGKARLGSVVALKPQVHCHILIPHQFLITAAENLDYLDGVHTVFGEVAEGDDVLAKINETFVDKDFVPFQDIR